MVIALKPLHDAARVTRCIVSTYQAVSGAGLQGSVDLVEGTKASLSSGEYAYSAFKHAIAFNAIPQIGKMVTGDGEPYSYLVESIRKFPNQQNFAAMITRAGFDRVSFRNYSAGIAALHSGWKL